MSLCLGCHHGMRCVASRPVRGELVIYLDSGAVLQAGMKVPVLATICLYLPQLIRVGKVIAVGVDVGVDCPLLGTLACVQDEV